MTAPAGMRITGGDVRRALWSYHFTPGGIEQVARRLGAIQYDPLAPMGRNADLVLQARVPGYRVDGWQEATYRRRLMLDAWDKMVCLTLTEDWPARHLFHAHFERQWQRRVFDPHRDAVAATLEELRERGPLGTLAFSDQRVQGALRGSWYGPKLVKHVLRALWDSGRVVTADRDNGRHVYDLPERSLPATVYRQPPLTAGAALERLVRRRVQAAGLLRPNGDASIWYMPVARSEVEEAAQRLVRSGELEQVEVEGVRFWAVPEALRTLDAPDLPSGVRFVAPLDGLLWDRRGVQHLYGFDYTWEVYKPEGLRRWGYYVLPVLWGTSFVARFDGRVRAGALELLSWYWEEGYGAAPLPAPLADALVEAAARFLRYLGVTRVRLPVGLGRAARSAWQAAARQARA